MQDDRAIFFIGNSFETVASSLKEDKSRQILVNASKFQVMLFGLNPNESLILEVGGCSIDVANSATLLRVAIDSKVKFNQHVLHIFQTVHRKISAFFEHQSALIKTITYPVQLIYSISI